MAEPKYELTMRMLDTWLSTARNQVQNANNSLHRVEEQVICLRILMEKDKLLKERRL